MKMRRMLLALPLVVIATAARAGTYELDPYHSNIVASVIHSGFASYPIVIRGLTGEIFFEESAPGASSVTAKIPALGLSAGEAELDSKIRQDLLGNQDIGFKSTMVQVTGEKTGKITGELTINGHSELVTFDAQLTGRGTHPFNNRDTVGFSGKTEISRKQFGMNGPGWTSFVSDTILISISVEASLRPGVTPQTRR